MTARILPAMVRCAWCETAIDGAPVTWHGVAFLPGVLAGAGGGAAEASRESIVAMTDADPDATISRLRAELKRATEDVAHLEQRLAYAQEEIRQLRARVVGKVTQAAVPSER